MHRHVYALPLLLMTLAGCGRREAPPPAAGPAGVLAARWHDSGFPEGDDSYNALHFARDGKLYYVICAHKIETGAQLFSYDPATGKSQRLADLTEAVGEKGLKAIPQGKSHVPFFEQDGRLYFATHLGYYEHSGGKELVGVPPPGYKPYPGGHFLAYEMATGKVEKLASAPAGEGIITLAMDPKSKRLYGLTWPTGMFLVYDAATKQVRNFGPVAGLGEKGTGAAFRVVCRSIAVDPGTGAAYFTVPTGEMVHYDPRKGTLEKLACTMRRDIFGQLDPDKPGHMGYNWRQTVWYEPEQVFYGVHGNSGYLFRFDPRAQQLEVLDRIAGRTTRAGGFYDSFSYGYLGLALGPDGQTLYYLTGTPAGEEIRLVTYHIPTRRYTDHGAVVFDDGRRPTWAQAIAIGPDKRVYTVTKLPENGKVKTELASFADPLRSEPPPAQRYRSVRAWTNPAGTMHPLQEAHSSCFDKDGNVIVVDSIGAHVHRFTPEGRWLNEIGLGPGTGLGQFKGPREAKVNHAGEIFVADANNYRIQVFTHEGKFIRAFGEQGSGPGQMLRVHGIEFSPDGTRLYVVDVDNNRVSVFEPSGKFLFDFGKKGGRPGEFRDPHGIGVAPNGDVIVSNYYGPVQRFAPDGKFRYEFGPAGFRGWVHFHSMITDREGNTYLAARSADRRNGVVKYDNRGAWVTEWTPSADVKSAAVDARGLVYVTLEARDRHGIEVFEKQ